MLTFENDVASPLPIVAGGQTWSSPQGESVIFEPADIRGEEDRGFGDGNGECALWEEGRMSDGVGGGHDLRTFTNDIGWLSPPDSYFLESGPSPNALDFGPYGSECEPAGWL